MVESTELMLGKEEASVMMDKEQVTDTHESEQTDYRTPAMKLAQEHMSRGYLGLTAEDHKAWGGSPPVDELQHNKGRTLGEIWSTERVAEYLQKKIGSLEAARKEYEEKGPNNFDSHWSRDTILGVKKELRATTPYLESIGKLPPEFKNYVVLDLPEDPLETK